MKMMSFILVLLAAGSALAQPPPDPHDSVIVESKTVNPLSGACASAGLRLKVWITNKDSLAHIALPFETRSVSGSAYGIISRSSDCMRSSPSAAFNFLYPPEPGGGQRLTSRGSNYTKYHSDSPDTFIVSFSANAPIQDNAIPPNPTRALLGEIKFDTVPSNLGTFEIDSGHVLANYLLFVSLDGNPHPPNFVKGVITVAFLKGDLNNDGLLTGVDVVLIRNCVVMGVPPPVGMAGCDLNCDGLPTSADFVLLVNAAFLGDPFPC